MASAASGDLAFIGNLNRSGAKIIFHISPDDYQGDIAIIMAKSMHDAKTEVTPKYNSRTIFNFRFKTVKAF